MREGRRSADATRTYDLAIVGYGPTGMTLAALVGQQGHDVLVLEKHAGLYNLPRAACFDDEIMRTFQKLGLVDEMLPGSVAQPSYEWVNGAGDLLLELKYENPARAGWAALYMMYQPHIETVLDRHCKSLPSVEVRHGVTVDGLDPGNEGVTLTCADRAGHRRTVRARYAVGADGGAGMVRSTLGIGVFDYDFQENWLVCDFHKRAGVDHLPTFRQVCDPAQPIAIVQIGPEHHRFSFMLERDEIGAMATDRRRAWQRVANYLGPEDAELVRVANYVFRSRIAECWRDGRVMLAGDAAHEMPPFLAQGMCSGIRDSHNLAWKLDLVLSGHADPEILDTYQPEREPHVRFITEKAIELGRVQTLRDPEAARRRDQRLLAERRARQEPETVRYPGLLAGMIATGDVVASAGEFFPQGRVASGSRKGMFDDVIGHGLCIVTQRREMLASVDAAKRDAWHRLGGRTAVLVDDRDTGGDGTSESPVLGVEEFFDLDGVYTSWFAAHGCNVAVIRPDWYVYGAASTGPDLCVLLDELSRKVRF